MSDLQVDGHVRGNPQPLPVTETIGSVRPRDLEHGVHTGHRTPTIHTIGHSTRSFDEVLAMLRVNAVNLVVDVRSFPASRKFPQWNRENIQAQLPPGIDYQWIQELGGGGPHRAVCAAPTVHGE